MSLFSLSRREQVLARIAPITDKPGTDWRMRKAVLRAKGKGPFASEFGKQQAFDQAVAGLVREIPVTQEISEWFRNEKLIPKSKRRWRKDARNPACDCRRARDSRDHRSPNLQRDAAAQGLPWLENGAQDDGPGSVHP
jgi:hypothetical protein